jgi:hypothetical protein
MAGMQCNTCRGVVSAHAMPSRLSLRNGNMRNVRRVLTRGRRHLAVHCLLARWHTSAAAAATLALHLLACPATLASDRWDF